MLRRLAAAILASSVSIAIAGPAVASDQVSGLHNARAAAALPPINLGVTNFGRILVDSATSHVFVSSPGSSAIVVLDLNGNVVKTISGESGAGYMALSGSTLYVALNTVGSIEKIDTGTLTDAGVLVSGVGLLAGGAGGVPPSDMVLAHSKVWVTTYDSTAASMLLVSVDPSTTPPTVTPYPSAFTGSNGLSSNATFASNATSNPNVLLAWESGTPADLTTFDVSSGSPVQLKNALEGNIQNPQDLAVGSDGAHFIAASGAPYEFNEYNLSDLKQDGVTYPAQAYPRSVVTSAAKGGLMAADSIIPGSSTTLWAYQIGRVSAPLAEADFSTNATTAPSRGVAISPDGSSAFVVSSGSPSPVLNVVPLAPPGVPAPPTGVTATAGLDSATVSWVAPVDQGSNPVTSYTVTSSPTAVTVQTPSTPTSVTVTLAPGPSYTFTVTATSATGSSVASVPSNPVMPIARLPGSPTNVIAIPGDGDAFVSWSPPADAGDKPISAYQITPYVATTAQTSTTLNGSPPATSAIVTGLTNNTTYTFVVAAITAVGRGPASSPSNPVMPIQGGNYHPLAPKRILDTRDGTGVVVVAPLGQNMSMDVQITGRGGVPTTGVTAVVLNATVTNTTAGSYLTLWPTGFTRPLASNLNWTSGKTVPNLVEVAVGVGGQVSVYNAAGQTDVIFDVAGWVGEASNSLTPDGLYHPIVPNRVLDTRYGTGVPKAPLGQGKTISLQVAGTPNVPATGLEAVVLNVTVTGPTAGSYLTVFPTGTDAPLASNLNFYAGQTVPNRVIVKLGKNPATGTDGWVSFYNAAGSVNVIADVGGWFTDATSTAGGARFTGTLPNRLLDSRDPGIGPLGPNQSGRLTIIDQNGTPVTGVTAIVINVTVTNPTAPSFLTLWPDGPGRPFASDLNFTRGLTVPNLVVVQLGTDSAFNIYNAAGSTDVIVDLVGFYGTPQPKPGAAGMRAFSLHASPYR